MNFRLLIFTLLLAPGLPLRGESRDAVPPTENGSWIQVSSPVWTLLSDEPEFHLSEARAAFERGDFAATAAEIRIASSWFDQRQQILERTQMELDEMADRVEGRELVSVDDLNRFFALALDTLAGRNWFPKGLVLDEQAQAEPGIHMARARKLFLEKKTQAAALNIRKVAAFMELNVQSQPEALTTPAIRREAADLRKLAGLMDQGVKVSLRRLDAAFNEARQALSISA